MSCFQPHPNEIRQVLIFMKNEREETLSSLNIRTGKRGSQISTDDVFRARHLPGHDAALKIVQAFCGPTGFDELNGSQLGAHATLAVNQNIGLLRKFVKDRNHVGVRNLEVASVDPSLLVFGCLLYTSPSPRDATLSRMPSSA